MTADGNEEQVLGKAYDARLMRRLLAYIKPYRASAYLAILCLLLAFSLVPVCPLFSRI
jgi:ATP-binding cassette, subfamily B, multidrug efflux pump